MYTKYCILSKYIVQCKSTNSIRARMLFASKPSFQIQHHNSNIHVVYETTNYSVNLLLPLSLTCRLC